MRSKFILFQFLFGVLFCTSLSSQGENGVWLFGNGGGIKFIYPANGDPYPVATSNAHIRIANEVATYSHIVNEEAVVLVSADGTNSYDVNGNSINDLIVPQNFGPAQSVVIVPMPQHPQRVHIHYLAQFINGEPDIYIDYAIIKDGIASRTASDIQGVWSPFTMIPIPMIAHAKGTCGNLWMIARNNYEGVTRPAGLVNQYYAREAKPMDARFDDSDQDFRNRWNWSGMEVFSEIGNARPQFGVVCSISLRRGNYVAP